MGHSRMAEARHTKVSLNLGVSLTLPVEHFLVGCNAGAHTHTHPIYSFYKLWQWPSPGDLLSAISKSQSEGRLVSILGSYLGAQTDGTLASTLGFSA